MTNRINLKEAIAWMALLLAIILFSFSVSFAQTQSVNVTNENGKVHLKIEKKSGDQTETIDTTFTINNDSELDRIIESYTGDSFSDMKENENPSATDKNESKIKKGKKIIVDIDLPEISKENQDRIDENLREAMKSMHKSLEEMSKSLREMHIHIDGDKDFNFDFDMPEIEYYLNDKSNHMKSDNEEVEIADSMNDDDHFIIFGKETDQPPVLEKVVKTKSGKQAFIYKRSSTLKKDNESISDESENKFNLKVFPNPGDGKLTIRFSSAIKNDLEVRIIDEKGRNIYEDKKKDFKGDYEKEIDLSQKPKGNYIVRVLQGKQSESVKVIIK